MKKITLVLICSIFTSTSFAYYNPEQGRWLNRDPIQEKGGQNLYGFCDNNSVSNIDRLGLKIVTYLYITFYQYDYRTFLVPLPLPSKLAGFLLNASDFIDRDAGTPVYGPIEKKMEVPDCYLANKDNERDEYIVDDVTLERDKVGGGVEPSVVYGVTVHYHHVIELSWEPDPNDPCCK